MIKYALDCFPKDGGIPPYTAPGHRKRRGLGVLARPEKELISPPADAVERAQTMPGPAERRDVTSASLATVHRAMTVPGRPRTGPASQPATAQPSARPRSTAQSAAVSAITASDGTRRGPEAHRRPRRWLNTAQPEAEQLKTHTHRVITGAPTPNCAH